ncbi:putative toxin-antitoxin system toxin component, PIN family [Vineibacter terrae]|uniref:Putative toxin-antitoxin system toxin component, PIN family n=1 Tax=Vineibacter terrae TaxID=2586908 RepID=A0A5C8PIA6_9HYPH|nr:putative toxin-antitoxin system toxin component, PIN family [Vineibacter terrae]TXL73542.1 putative toxin-antitoxin system toxin component, PIN family [Vineibacter terrae]
MRVVLDTNVVVSGLMLPASRPGRILAAWEAGLFLLVTSDDLLAELADVLDQPKIRRRVRWSKDSIDDYVSTMRAFSHVVNARQYRRPIVRDINDDIVLATMVAGRADWLVTGDKDFLVLAEGYPILSPAAFWLRHGW